MLYKFLNGLMEECKLYQVWTSGKGERFNNKYFGAKKCEKCSS